MAIFALSFSHILPCIFTFVLVPNTPIRFPTDYNIWEIVIGGSGKFQNASKHDMEKP